jgi:nucleotide-binding universal stress UspA family protein
VTIAVDRVEVVMIRNILVPTDFSAGSEIALAYAKELAGATGAALHFIHVVPNAFGPGAYSETYVPPPREYFEGLEKDARTRLEQWVPASDQRAFRAVLTAVVGAPSEEILARVTEEPPIDLIVMATHGRGGVARVVMGSVADQIVRRAPCPVLTVREDSKARARTAA